MREWQCEVVFLRLFKLDDASSYNQYNQ
jgi:hypothetical protein